jgi:hypothetical protein
MRALRRRSRDAHDLLVYLVTCPHSNLVGMFSLSPAHAAADLCWPARKLTAALAELEADEVAFYDVTAEVIYVPAILQWQPIATDKQAEGAVRRLEGLPETALIDRLRQDLLRQGYADATERTRPLLEFLGLTPPVTQTVRHPVRQAVTGGTPSPSPSPSQTQTQTQAPAPTGNGPLRGTIDAQSLAIRGRDGTPRTAIERLVEDRILPLTREPHRRDEWLKELAAPGAVELVITAIERTEAAAESGGLQNPAAFLWATYRGLRGTH